MRCRKVVSFGRDRTALAAYRAAVEKLARLNDRLDQGATDPVGSKTLRRAVARVRRLEQLAMVQAAIEATAPGQAGRTNVEIAREIGVAPGVVEKAWAVRERPDLWARFLALELNLGMAALLASKPPGWHP
jgi:hypothetical protein